MKLAKHRHPIVLKILALILAFAAIGCIGKRNGAGSSATEGPGAPGDGSTPTQTPLSQLVLGVGTRDFNQLNQAMASVTGIDPRNSNAVNTFNQVTSSLPGTNDMTTLAGPNVVAVTRLAAQYCDLAVANGSTVRAAMFPGIDFTKSANSISSAARDGVINTLLVRFTKDATPSPDDVATLQQLYADLSASTTSTVGLMVALCTATLGSVKAVVAL